MLFLVGVENSEWAESWLGNRCVVMKKQVREYVIPLSGPEGGGAYRSNIKKTPCCNLARRKDEDHDKRKSIVIFAIVLLEQILMVTAEKLCGRVHRV